MFRASYLLSIFLVLFSIPVFAGSITGKALFDGTPGENPKIDMTADPVCRSLNPGNAFQERIVVNSNHTLKNVFVYVKGLEGQTFPVSQMPVQLNQHGCAYHPRVLGMQTNQKLQIVNSDSTLHNVHAFSKKSPEFNLGMPLQGMKVEKTFSNPEVMVKMKCDVHPWMTGYIGVLNHPFFAVTGDDGSFKIDNVPPGDYVVEAWHETYGTKTQNVTVTDAGTQSDFKFSATEIADEASGLKIKAGPAKPTQQFDDSAALNVPRPKMHWWLPPCISTFGKKIDRMFYGILILTGLIFFGVQGTLLYFLFKYRERSGTKALYTHGNQRLEIIWTIIPSIILVILTIFSQQLWSEIKMAIPAGAIPIEIHAEQFAWNVIYPGPDGKFGTADDIKTINQLHIPIGKPVKATLSSIGKDGKHPVIHSFFLPEFRLKQDVMPGMNIPVWFEATKTGKYEIACAEFCGLGHYRMRGFLSIHSPEGYEAWLKEQAGTSA